MSLQGYIVRNLLIDNGVHEWHSTTTSVLVQVVVLRSVVLVCVVWAAMFIVEKVLKLRILASLVYAKTSSKL